MTIPESKLTIECKCPECGKTHLRRPFDSQAMSETTLIFFKKSLCDGCRTRRDITLISRINERMSN